MPIRAVNLRVIHRRPLHRLPHDLPRVATKFCPIGEPIVDSLGDPSGCGAALAAKFCRVIGSSSYPDKIVSAAYAGLRGHECRVVNPTCVAKDVVVV